MPEAKAVVEKVDIDAEAQRAAAETMNKANGVTRPTEVTLSTGVVLKVKPVPPFLVRKAVMALKRPEVPTFYNEDKERNEPNPSDPDYLSQLEAYEQRTYDAGANVMLIAGTEVLNIPQGVSGPDDDDWVELAAAVGIELDLTNRHSRYLAWLTCSAITSADDLAAVVQAVTGLTGISEEEASETVSSFRNRATRRANRDLPSEAP